MSQITSDILEQNPFQQTLDRLTFKGFTRIACHFPYFCRFSYISPVTELTHVVSIQCKPFSANYTMMIDRIIDYNATHEDVIYHLNHLP